MQASNANQIDPKPFAFSDNLYCNSFTSHKKAKGLVTYIFSNYTWNIQWISLWAKITPASFLYTEDTPSHSSNSNGYWAFLCARCYIKHLCTQYLIPLMSLWSVLTWLRWKWTPGVSDSKIHMLRSPPSHCRSVANGWITPSAVYT